MDACLRASNKSFYDDSEACLHDSGGHAWHVIRSDATNAKIWQRQKLHVCQVESLYSLQAADAGEIEDTSLLADLMVVTSGTGVACRAMIRKQCRSTGMPLWEEILKKVHTPPTPAEAQQRFTLVEDLRRQAAAVHPDKKIGLTTFLQITDAGSDQSLCRKLISEELRHALLVLHISSNCLAHQNHLGFKASLNMSEACLKLLSCDLVYFSSLAKIANCWREVGKDIHQTWCALFGAQHGNQAALRPAPKCLRSRWGSTHESEEHMLKCDAAELRRVLVAVFGSATSKRKASSARADDPLQELDEEEIASYVAKMGRWRKDACQIVSEPTWWLVLRVSHRCRGPWHSDAMCHCKIIPHTPRFCGA